MACACATKSPPGAALSRRPGRSRPRFHHGLLRIWLPPLWPIHQPTTSIIITSARVRPEVGYHNQDAASLVADFEGKKLFDPKQRIRNLETHGYTPVAQVLAQKDAISGDFSPERWQATQKKDIAWFSARPPAKRQQMLQDKGYNGTPVWTMVAGFLTNRISTGNDWGMRFLVALDPILLAIMFAGIWWAFGLEVMLLAVCFLGHQFRHELCTHQGRTHAHGLGARPGARPLPAKKER